MSHVKLSTGTKKLRAFSALLFERTKPVPSSFSTPTFVSQLHQQHQMFASFYLNITLNKTAQYKVHFCLKTMSARIFKTVTTV